MSISALLRGGRLSRLFSSRVTAAGICTEEVFRRVLERERARADRNAHEFALVVFELCRFARSNGHARQAVEFLANRIRFTDICGCLGPLEIGVILPDTNRAGARTFAASVSRAITERIVPVGYRIYQYPARSEDDRQLRLPDIGISEIVSADSNGLGRPHTVQCCSPPGGTCQFGWTADQCLARLGEKKNIEEYFPVRHCFAKRVFDIVASLLALLLLAPLMLGIALLIKLVSPGPVLFRQPRVGFRGKIFTCLKFRTMHVNSDAEMHRAHIASLMQAQKPMTKLDAVADPRIIPFGRFLRATALDELPQLFNVLKGDMSLIGPRPCIVYEYKAFDHWHRTRTDALPGMTGLWQVKGKNRTTFAQMMRLDISYARKRSFWLDLKILFLTVPTLAAQATQDLVARVRGPRTLTRD